NEKHASLQPTSEIANGTEARKRNFNRLSRRPSRDGARSAVLPAGRITSSFILVVPSQDAVTGFVCRLVGSASAACVVSGLFLLHIGASLRTTQHRLTNRVTAMLQVLSPVS